MTFRSATSLDGKDADYDSVTVRIKVTPVETDVKSITYTAIWVNAASVWAKGKNVSDFLSVNQMIISKNPQFTGISARQQLEFTTHLLLTD